jgi:septum formation protein
MAEQERPRLILGSGSLGRRELLQLAGYQFEVLPAGIDEPDGPGFADARSLVQHVAWLKAAAVVPHVPSGVVLTADTVGWIDGQVIGKPADAADARRILRLLAGREHELWTGVCLWRRPGEFQLAWQEVSGVAMAPLDEAAIDRYLATRTWEGCSGAYAVQGDDDPYVRVLAGSVSNVIGLPMETTVMALETFGGIPRPARTGPS